MQEIRAKRTLDHLAVLDAPHARVRARRVASRRSRSKTSCSTTSVDLRTGDQVPADGEVRSADGLEIDESLLTGEADPSTRRSDTEVLSGSFVVAGSGRFQATRVGREAYAR